jgi:hypothetical protein
MTKGQMQSEINSALFELEYVIKQLQNRVDFNNIERVETESKDDDSGMEMAKKCGSFQALTHMANVDIGIAIKNLTKTIKDLEKCK